jgi:HD-GYP domain-containing protein (c-di-GMP phosphodiesterase class II)
VLAVCDVYDALVSDRVYRGAWTPERAFTLLRDGAQFDQECVAALRQVLAPPFVADIAAPSPLPAAVAQRAWPAPRRA